MVNEKILSVTKTISDEKELEKVFNIDNTCNINNNTNSKISIIEETIDSTDYTNYYVMEAIRDGFLDMKTWNRIKQFEKDNPEKIKEWKEDNQESNSYILSDKTNCEEKVIKLCLSKHPRSKFVLSVNEQYKRNGRISEKQMDALKRILTNSKW